MTEPSQAAVPALALPAVTTILDTFWSRSTKVVGRQVVDSFGMIKGIIEPTEEHPIPDDMGDCFQALKTLAGHQLLRFLVFNALGRTVRGDDPVLAVDGAAAIARTLRFQTGRQALMVRRALVALRHVHVDLPALGWVPFLDTQERGRKLVVTIREPLLISYASTLAKRQMHKEKRLVPFPAVEAPLVGHPFWWAAQSAMQIEVLREMRLQATGMLDGAGVTFARDGLLDIARKYEMPTDVLDQTLIAWTDDVAGQFLSPQPNGSFALSDEYEASKAMLVDAGAMTLSGQHRRAKALRKKAKLPARPLRLVSSR
jgi:hypothetical protein